MREGRVYKLKRARTYEEILDFNRFIFSAIRSDPFLWTLREHKVEDRRDRVCRIC